MLPHVEHQQRLDAPLGQILVLFGLQNLKLTGARFPDQQRPTAALDLIGRRGEMGLEPGKAAKILADLRGQIAGWLAAAALPAGAIFGQKIACRRWPEP